MNDNTLDMTSAARQAAALAVRLADERAADIVDALNEQSPEVAAQILQLLPQDRAIEALDQPGLDHGPEIVTAAPPEKASALLAGVSADRVADLFRELEEPTRSELLGHLD